MYNANRSGEPIRYTNKGRILRPLFVGKRQKATRWGGLFV